MTTGKRATRKELAEEVAFLRGYLAKHERERRAMDALYPTLCYFSRISISYNRSATYTHHRAQLRRYVAQFASDDE